MEDTFWWKKHLEEKEPVVEDDFDGRQPLVENDIDGLQPSMEDVLKWKIIFDDRQHSMKDNLWRSDMLSLRLPKLEFET